MPEEQGLEVGQVEVLLLLPVSFSLCSSPSTHQPNVGCERKKYKKVMEFLQRVEDEVIETSTFRKVHCKADALPVNLLASN